MPGVMVFWESWLNGFTNEDVIVIPGYNNPVHCDRRLSLTVRQGQLARKVSNRSPLLRPWLNVSGYFYHPSKPLINIRFEAYCHEDFSIWKATKKLVDHKLWYLLHFPNNKLSVPNFLCCFFTGYARKPSSFTTDDSQSKIAINTDLTKRLFRMTAAGVDNPTGMKHLAAPLTHLLRSLFPRLPFPNSGKLQVCYWKCGPEEAV